MQQKKSNHFIFIMNTIRFFLIVLLVPSGIKSIILYATVSIFDFMEIKSWWSAWLFSLITLCGMPLALLIDGIAGMLYEAFGSLKTKRLFLFIAKTLEVFLLIGIVHQADEWLKGVASSTWSEVILGYCIFLFLEGVFAFGNWISNHKEEVKVKEEVK